MNEQKIAHWLEISNDSRLSLVEKCLNLAKLVEYQDLDITKYAKKIKEIGDALHETINEIKNPTYLISMLNEHLFDNFGLVGDEDDYYNPKNNFLNEVIDKKSGLPITVSIIYVEIAKYIGLDMQLVGFPSHVLVKYKDELVLDPFYGGRVVQVEDMQQILDMNFEGTLEFSPEFLTAISTRQILVRIIRNLKNSYMQSYAFEKALLCVDLAMTLEKDVAIDIRDRGIIEERLSHYDLALEHLKQYLEASPNAEDADFVLGLIQNIREKINQ